MKKFFFGITTPILCSLIVAVLFTSCFQAVETNEEEEIVGKSSDSNLTFRITRVGEEPFLSPGQSDSELSFSRLCFAVYGTDGQRVDQINQQAEDKSFGEASFHLDEGDYKMVVIAHSSPRNPTMTNLSKVQFNNSTGYTDTYLYYTTLAVTGEPQTVTLTLGRICSLCRFVISDPIPDGVSQIKFRYTGGSGHFSALTGLGVTNSTQVVTRQVQPGQQYQVFDLYTFLHQQEGTIALTASALDAAGESLYEWEFDIPMARNQITWFTGNFFTGESASTRWLVTPNIALDTSWARQFFCTY